MNLRHAIRDADSGVLLLAKRAHRALRRASLPGDQRVWRPAWLAISASRGVWLRARSALFVTPVWRGACESLGEGFSAGAFLPFVTGRGRIHLGDRVTVGGKLDVVFGASSEELPELRVGDDVFIGHDSVLSVSGSVVIGDHCLLAGGVSISDCNGHPLDPELRLAKAAPTQRDVRPVRIGRNVWIGSGALILPGTDIGDNCVIGARARVKGVIPADSLVLPGAPTVTPLVGGEGPRRGRPRDVRRRPGGVP